MKLTSFLTENRCAYGIVTDSGVIDLSRLSETPDNLCSALTDPGAEQLAVLGAELVPDLRWTRSVLHRQSLTPKKLSASV